MPFKEMRTFKQNPGSEAGRLGEIKKKKIFFNFLLTLNIFSDQGWVLETEKSPRSGK